MDDHGASDEDLMLRLQKSRDEPSFNLLFTRYRGPIMSYLFRLVGNRSEAESLAQDTFLRILEKSAQYAYPKRFSTWFYTIARNLATDFLKKKRAVVPDDFQGLSDAVQSPEGIEAEGLVAAIVGCPESTARSRMDYGLEFLRKSYRRHDRRKFPTFPDETSGQSYK